MAGPQREPIERVGANQFVGPVEVFRNRCSPVLPVRLRLTRPVSEINSRRSEQDANPRVHCTFGNVRRPPGTEPWPPKPKGCWTAFKWARQSQAVITDATPKDRWLIPFISTTGWVAPDLFRHHDAVVP